MSEYVKEGEQGAGPVAAPEEEPAGKFNQRTAILLATDAIYVAAFFSMFTEVGCARPPPRPCSAPARPSLCPHAPALPAPPSALPAANRG